MAKASVNTSELNIHHIAFIMDGNGRWAKKRGLPREAGHKAGAAKFKKIVERCCELGIEASTYYVFSTENWKRPQKEVDALMKILEQYLDDGFEDLIKNNVKYNFMGDLSPLYESIKSKIKKIEELSSGNKFIVNLGLNYGGRSEIVHAVKVLNEKGINNPTEDDISSEMYTKGSPELDLIVRTGGDVRLSNFLLWQSAYAEFYFMDKLWPDIEPRDVDHIVKIFGSRNRRFGGVENEEG